MKVTSEVRFGLRPCTWVYLALMFLTLVTWWIGEFGMSGLSISLSVLGLALFKGFMIGDWFMGLRGIKGAWRWVVVIWLLVPGVLIAWAFALAAR